MFRYIEKLRVEEKYWFMLSTADLARGRIG